MLEFRGLKGEYSDALDERAMIKTLKVNMGGIPTLRMEFLVLRRNGCRGFFHSNTSPQKGRLDGSDGMVYIGVVSIALAPCPLEKIKCIACHCYRCLLSFADPFKTRLREESTRHFTLRLSVTFMLTVSLS